VEQIWSGLWSERRTGQFGRPVRRGYQEEEERGEREREEEKVDILDYSVNDTLSLVIVQYSTIRLIIFYLCFFVL